MSYDALLRDPAHSGVYRKPDRAFWIARVARANDFAYWRVDLANVRSKSALLAELANALEFPEWFGGNWDALQDCLTDLSWRQAPGYVLAVEHCRGLAEAAPEVFRTTLEVLHAAARWWAGERVPFWVFVDDIDENLRALPRVDAAP